MKIVKYLVPVVILLSAVLSWGIAAEEKIIKDKNQEFIEFSSKGKKIKIEKLEGMAILPDTGKVTVIFSDNDVARLNAMFDEQLRNNVLISVKLPGYSGNAFFVNKKITKFSTIGVISSDKKAVAFLKSISEKEYGLSDK